MDSRNSVGRPRTTSRVMLEDAAAELFLENTYALTTIEQIAQRAGVSRNTFFNYFGAKSDLLWVELDAGIDRLAEELSTVPPGVPALAAVRDAALRVAADIGVDRVPLALTQDDVMGTREETRSSGLVRLARRSDVIASFLARQLSRPSDDLLVLSAANAISGALSAAWTAWARDGIGRGHLVDYVSSALEIVSTGLEVALPDPTRPAPSGG
ncbi:TetR/AcrR family transcriptional regulator [Lacisediminihabitans profunda]|uniref:TetR family transcriptional regulator n=1 Tax=Lacisediminihabitans profunda TaxID=2594790 RepID=A0A5C8UTY2_9MICO|nr:TetR/AcrR family transcriptional regulator [Lacisediminihabitans profunda]TXN31413.1 TetR family transcriptional regulator [Lacisediminihabitans profunda]